MLQQGHVFEGHLTDPLHASMRIRCSAANAAGWRREVDGLTHKVEELSALTHFAPCALHDPLAPWLERAAATKRAPLELRLRGTHMQTVR